MLAQTPCREFANRWEPKDYFIISAIGLEAAATLLLDTQLLNEYTHPVEALPSKDWQ